MLEWLAVWGVASATASAFKPILEELAENVAKDISKSYVKKCFSSVFSAFHQKPLAKATGLAVKKLLDLIEDELLDADLSREQAAALTDDVQRFLDREEIATAIGSLFLDPDYHLDPALLARAWQRSGAGDLPDAFSWQRIAKRIAREVRDIRSSYGELKETFESLSSQQNSEALKELQGLPPKFDIETYREALIERYGILDFASLDMTGAYYSDVRLWSVFVPQSVRECHEYDPQLLEVPKEHLERLAAASELDAQQLAESEKLHQERRRAYVNQPPRHVLGVADDAAIQRRVILGDPGSGKSSLLRFLALRWTRIDDANLRYTQPLPLLVELRDYNRWECASGKGFAKYLHEASTWHRLNQQTLKHLLEQPDRVVLLLDGLDEVFDPVEREQVVNDIHRFSNDYKHVRIVVTSRVVGYQPHRLRSADFRHFMLQDLDEDQIGQFLDKWHDVTFDKPEDADPKRDRLNAAIKNSKSIAQLAGNPLLLTMMAILNRNQKLPDDRVDLYQQCSRLLLYQWDVEGKLLEEFPGLSAEIGLREKTDILRTVAYAMQTGIKSGATAGLPSSAESATNEDTAVQASSGTQQAKNANYIDRQTLESLIEDYLHTELRFEQARAVARALVEQLRARNFILCYLGADSYAFVHRTFLEYFCAADIVHQFNVAQTLSEQQLIDLFDTHCRDDDWREVLRLICGQIDEQFVGRIVEHLATRTDLENWDGESPLPELPLAIWCFSECRNLERLAPVGQMLMTSTLEVLARIDSFEVWFDNVIPACREVGERWPGKQAAFEFAPKGKMLLSYGYEPWVTLLAAIDSTRSRFASLVHSTQGFVRASALWHYAEKWPDETTRELLTQRAVHDEYRDARRASLFALAEKWPDQTTRELLTQRVVQDEEYGPRIAAIRALSQKWPDETTRELLEQRAFQDEDGWGRSAALDELSRNWPDETTRELLTQRAVEDEDGYCRGNAFQALAWKWPDDTTRELLAERIFQESSIDARCSAFFALGTMHSEFGRNPALRFLVAYCQNVDPLEPMTRKHIEKVAERAGIPSAEIDASVESLSTHLGWDITRGAKASSGRKRPT